MSHTTPARSSFLAAIAVIIEVALAVLVRAQETPLDYDHVLSHRRIMEELASMVNESERNPREIEIAAFLVRDFRNRVALIRWPDSQDERTQTWIGPLPSGVIATVHTHPNGWRKPSPEDHGEATRIGLPFLVLTRWDIWVAEPGKKHATRLVWNEDWRGERYLAALGPREGTRESTTIAATEPAQPRPSRYAEPATTGLR